MAVAVAAVALVGVVAVIGRSGSDTAGPAAVGRDASAAKPSTGGDGHPTAASAEGPAPIAPAAHQGPGTAPSITPPPHPTAEDVQRILAGITAEIMAPPSSTASTKPLTKEQVEAEVRSKLSQLGINY